MASPRGRAGLVARWRRRTGLRWMGFTRAIQADRDLATGTNSVPAEVRARRAARITRRRVRLRLAGGLDRVLSSAYDTGATLTAAVRPDRHEVLSARIVLGTLERRLRAPEPVRARGVAMLRLLLTEPDSALYRPAESGALGSRLRAAAAELEPREGPG